MGAFDKMKNQAQQASGKAKEAVGDKTGNEDMRNAGKRDQMEGETRQAGQDMKDKAAGAMHDAKKSMGKGQHGKRH